MDESIQVLVFICLPLALLLVGVLVFLNKTRGTSITFPKFSVSVRRIGPNEAYVMYAADGKEKAFDAEINRGKRFFVPRISVCIPKEIQNADIPLILLNLTTALGKLHYEYSIYRLTEPQEIPEAERQAAVTELRQLGFEFEDLPDRIGVTKAVTRNWRPSSGQEAKALTSRVQVLMHKARGIHQDVEILARNDQ